jgi:hypothetical protein
MYQSELISFYVAVKRVKSGGRTLPISSARSASDSCSSAACARSSVRSAFFAARSCVAWISNTVHGIQIGSSIRSLEFK